MEITSSAFENNKFIPAKYTCNGEGVNPPLAISGLPEGTKSLVLILNDPDATIGTFQHWIVYNIAPETSVIEENSVPKDAIELENDLDKANYGGPCPSKGTHRYFFKIFALDSMLNIPMDSKIIDLEVAMSSHILDQAELVGLYKKK